MPTKTTDYSDNTVITQIKIAANQSVSNPVDLGGTSLIGIQTSDTLAGTQITFNVSAADYLPLGALTDTSGTPFTIPVQNQSCIPLDPVIFAPWRIIQLSIANQAADVYINLISGQTIGDGRRLI